MEDPQPSHASRAKWLGSTIAEVSLGKHHSDCGPNLCRFWKILHTLMLYSTLPAKCWMVNFSSASVEGMKKESSRCCCFNLSKRALSDAWWSLEKRKEEKHTSQISCWEITPVYQLQLLTCSRGPVGRRIQWTRHWSAECSQCCQSNRCFARWCPLTHNLPERFTNNNTVAMLLRLLNVTVFSKLKLFGIYHESKNIF